MLVFFEDTFPKLPGGPYFQNVIGMALIGGLIVGLSMRSATPISMAWATVSFNRY